MGNLVGEGEALGSSQGMVAGMLQQGSATLSDLVSQRDRMKGVRRMMLDMATTLGVSNTTLRVVERRENQDRMLVFAGCTIVTALIWFLYR